jgi:hypothetical protein
MIDANRLERDLFERPVMIDANRFERDQNDVQVHLSKTATMRQDVMCFCMKRAAVGLLFRVAMGNRRRTKGSEESHSGFIPRDTEVAEATVGTKVREGTLKAGVPRVEGFLAVVKNDFTEKRIGRKHDRDGREAGRRRG